MGLSCPGASAKHNNGPANSEPRFSKLAVVPKGCPLAPGNDEFSEEIRQMVVGPLSRAAYVRHRSSCAAVLPLLGLVAHFGFLDRMSLSKFGVVLSHGNQLLVMLVK